MKKFFKVALVFLGFFLFLVALKWAFVWLAESPDAQMVRDYWALILGLVLAILVATATGIIVAVVTEGIDYGCASSVVTLITLVMLVTIWYASGSLLAGFIAGVVGFGIGIAGIVRLARHGHL